MHASLKNLVAAEVEVEESVVKEDQEEITVNRDEDDHEQMTIARKHEIKWCHTHSPQSSILPFQNHLIYDRHPISPYKYFKQYVSEALFDLMSDSTNIYAMQSGTLGFKSTRSVSHPEVVKLYKEAIGGVVLLDQLVSLYRTEIRSRKWTLRMITHAFDLVVVNSWLEYRLDAKRANLQRKDTLDLLHFKMNVAQCLVGVHKPVAAKRGRPSMSSEPQPHAHIPRVQYARPLPEVQYDMVDHMPNYD